MSALLEVVDLTVRHGGITALDGVSFEIERGEVVGLIGPNGAGKTTCIDALSGFVPADRGAVRLDGRAVGALAPHRRARLGLGRTFQDLDLFDDLTVRQNIEVGASVPTWRDTVRDALWPTRRDAVGVDDVLERLGITALVGRDPGDLSNGERHLVAIARAVAVGPQLLLLDEPAAGLDAAETARLGRMLRQLPTQGTSVLLVEHDMSLVLEVCDRVHVLDFGRRIASGAPAEVRADPIVIDAYLGAGPVVGS